VNLKDKLLILGETTGLVELTLDEIIINNKSSSSAKKGDEVTFVTPELVRRNDRVYLIEELS